jgi:hypothetical protein
MQVRGLLVAVALLAVLGGLVYWSTVDEKAKEDQPSPDAAPKILDIAEDQFQEIEIRPAGKPAVILKTTESGEWEMTAPETWPVDQSTAGSLVSTLSSLNSDRLVEENATDFKPFGLESPELEVSVRKKDGSAVRLLVGDQNPTGSYYFARLADDPRLFTLPSYNKSSLEKTPSDLRDKRLLRFDSGKLARVELQAKGQTVEFGKNDDKQWQIVKPAPYRTESFQVDELVRKLSDARMEASAFDEDPPKAAAAFAAGSRVAKVVVTDDKASQELEIRKSKDDYYARSSAVEGTYKVSSYLGEGVDKSLDDFRNKKLFDFGFVEPNRVEIRDGDQTRTFAKEGDKWMAAGKQMEGADVQTLIDKLRDLSASGFATGGFASPSIEATVVYDDSRKTDKVLIARAGSKYLARRDNEPAIYELDSSAVEGLTGAASSVKEYQPPKDDKDDKDDKDGEPKS